MLHAQVCTPNANICNLPPEPVVPGCYSNLDSGNVGQPYSDIIYFVFKDTFVFSGSITPGSPVITAPVAAKKIKIVAVKNMPAGLVWQPGTADSTFRIDQAIKKIIGCVKISGTPTESRTITDSISIDLLGTVDVNFGGTIIPNIEQIVPFKVPLVIKGSSGVAEKFNQQFLNVTLYPNPTTGITKLHFSQSSVSNISIHIVDNQGAFVYQSKVLVPTLDNNEVILPTIFTPGIYTIIITTDQGQALKRWITK
jgi:hypothetical protein